MKREPRVPTMTLEQIRALQVVQEDFQSALGQPSPVTLYEPEGEEGLYVPGFRFTGLGERSRLRFPAIERNPDDEPVDE